MLFAILMFAGSIKGDDPALGKPDMMEPGSHHASRIIILDMSTLWICTPHR